MEAVIPKKNKKIFVDSFLKNFKRFEFPLSKNMFQLKLLSKSKKQRSSIEFRFLELVKTNQPPNLE